MKRIAVKALLLVAGALGAGCGWFDDPSPDRARLVLDGDPGTPIRVITSVDFLAARNEVGETRVQLIAADTMYRTLPLDTTYLIRGKQRFFAEAARDEADVSSFRMRIFLDQERRFDEGGPLLEEGPFRFVYALNQFFEDVTEVF